MNVKIDKDLIISEFNPKDGVTYVDVIKSHIAPDRERLLELLSFLEKRQIGNCELSDRADEMWEEISDECKYILGIQDKKNIDISVHTKDLDFINYKNSFNWETLFLLMDASTSPLLIEDIPFIREFLNCPIGKEKEAEEKWYEYWSKIDFSKRFDIALM